jgi:hypothetical protein
LRPRDHGSAAGAGPEAQEGGVSIIPFDSAAATNAELDAKQQELEATQGERALAAVHSFIGRFVCYPSEHARVAHTLWIAHAHLMDRWFTTPRIAFNSPEKGSGKSRALEATIMLTPNPILSVSQTPAYLVRKIGMDGGATVCLDEVDAIFGPAAKEHEDLRALLNAGYRRGATYGRCVLRGKAVETEELDAYAAVAMAGLGNLPDTIADRTVIVRMRKRHAGEKVEPLRPRIHGPEGDRVRHQLELWTRTLPKEVEWPALPAAIEDRAADLWEPLVSIADMAGGDWPARARAAAVALVAAGKEQDATLGVQLLSDIKSVFVEEEMTSKALVAALVALEESPWGDLRGKPLDERGLARRLKPYDIKPQTIRMGTATPRGYYRADFLDMWRRHVPSSPENTETTKTTETLPPVSDVADVLAFGEKRREEISHRHKCRHCGERGETVQCSYDGVEFYAHKQCIDAWIADYRDRAGYPLTDTGS